MLRRAEELLTVLSSKQTDFDYCLGNVSILTELWKFGLMFHCKTLKIWGVLLELSFVSKAVLVSPSTVNYAECKCPLNCDNHVYQSRETSDFH